MYKDINVLCLQWLTKSIGPPQNNTEPCSKLSRAHTLERIEVFRRAFRSHDDGTTAPALALVRKLIAVLESIEKLPVYTYDSPSSGYGLQVSTRVIHPCDKGVSI